MLIPQTTRQLEQIPRLQGGLDEIELAIITNSDPVVPVPNATVSVPNADPANNPRFLPFHQVVFRGIGGLNALIKGTRLVSTSSTKDGPDYQAIAIGAAIVEMAALNVGSWLLLRPRTRFRHTLIVVTVVLTALGILLSNILPN